MKTKRTDASKRRQRKSNGTQPRQAAFLAAYATCGVISAACTLAKVNRTAHYDWIKDPAYAERFEQAEKDACEALETEARRRASTGWDEPVFYKGTQCATVRKFSDTLLIFLMKGAMPQKYRDNVNIEGDLKIDLGSLVVAARKRANGDSTP